MLNSHVGINKYKKGRQLRINLVKTRMVIYMQTYCIIWAEEKNYFTQLLMILGRIKCTRQSC